MIINKLKINEYGKLHNKEIELSNNINIIYGNNESGKSTLFNFIINSLYGISLILINIFHGGKRNFQVK